MFQKDSKAEYKKMKAKLALLEASPSKVSDDEEVTQVKVLIALANDELTVRKSHARNGEWVDITIRKGASPSSEVTPLTFQPHPLRERPGLGIVGIKSLLEVTTAKLTGIQQVVSELVALRNFVKKKLLLHSRSVCYKEMDQDSAHMVAASKVPMLKPGEYELWRMRMEQYIQMINYSLWEVIENGNAPLITKVVEGVETTIAPTTAEKRHKGDAKSLLQSVEKRFGGNAATKKTFDHLQVDCKKVNQKQFQNTKPIWNNAQRVNHQNFAKKSHPCVKKNIVPRAVLIKSGLVSVNTTRQVNTAHPKITVNAARPMTNLSKTTHSTIKRPIHKNTAFKNSNFNQRVNTVKDKKFNIVRPKAVVNAARPKAVFNAVKGNNVNSVKASACWVWKPKTKVLDHVSKHDNASITLKKFDYGNPQMDLQDKGVIDSGCSRHMTGNMSYLTDYEEIDGGYVAFRGNPKGGKIIGKGTIKTGNLDFKNVYFVRELKFNLFSVSQMCDKKNSVLFNDTECIVLSPNFKLTDESQVLLKVPRKNNMYSVDLKNIVPKGGLTCLFAEATSDESKLWHRRLGHINFKTMNKLVKGIL
ncbi:ribonuclease H-like domain-containing protein [Tanacetum coccineum]